MKKLITTVAATAMILCASGAIGANKTSVTTHTVTINNSTPYPMLAGSTAVKVDTAYTFTLSNGDSETLMMNNAGIPPPGYSYTLDITFGNGASCGTQQLCLKSGASGGKNPVTWTVLCPDETTTVLSGNDATGYCAAAASGTTTITATVATK